MSGVLPAGGGPYPVAVCSVPLRLDRNRGELAILSGILDDGPVSGPRLDDGLARADAGGAGVVTRAEVVVLRGTRGASQDARVDRAVDREAEDLVEELGVVAHDRHRQVVAHRLAGGDHFLQPVAAVGHKHLHGPEYFGEDQFPLLRVF